MDRSEELATRPIGPLLASTTAQTTFAVVTYGIYALTNAWFVSWGVGPLALAGVNLMAPLLLLLGAISTTVGVGGASVVSRALGAGDHARAARACGNAFMAFWSVALVVGVLGVILIEPLLTLLNAPPEVRAYARDYGVILLAGAVTATGFSALIRAEGRIGYATAVWVIPVLTQIVLDPLLIFGAGLGVRGAGFGTVGGQAVSMAMSLWYFFGRADRPYPVRLSDLRPDARVVREIVGVGAPSFLANLGAMLVLALANATVSRTGGATALASFAIASRIGTFILMPQLGLSQGMQPIIGFNAGRLLTSRVSRTRTLALRASAIYGTVMALLVLVLAPWVVRGFTAEPAMAGAGPGGVRVPSRWYPPAGVAVLVAAYFQAIGRPRPSWVLSVAGVLAVRVPAVLLLGLLGVNGVLASYVVAEVVLAAASLLVLRSVAREFR